jgi:hypothetical protein
MADAFEGQARALALLIRALDRYPAPVPVPPPPGEKGPGRYAPALDIAMTIYAERFQRSEEEETIKSAFAAVAPKVLERGEALVGTIMNAIVDGGRPPGVQADYMTLMHELSTLATVFVGPPGAVFTGPYAPQYTAVCEMIKGLMEVSPK